MSLHSNLKAFMASRGGDPLVNSYLMLVGFELAFKNAGYTTHGGHDVPEMLVKASRKTGLPPPVSGQLKTHSEKLKRLLSQLLCQSVSGSPQKVPASNYPYMRYCRYPGDWGGAKENDLRSYNELEQFCLHLSIFLKVQKNILGIAL